MATASMLFACGNATVMRVRGPDGEPALHIACEQDINYCTEEATEQCPRGYVVLQRGDTPGTSLVVSPSSHYLIVRCYRKSSTAAS
jgi:hypothetical protein